MRCPFWKISASPIVSRFTKCFKMLELTLSLGFFSLSFIPDYFEREKVKSSFQFFNDPLCMLKSACAALHHCVHGNILVLLKWWNSKCVQFLRKRKKISQPMFVCFLLWKRNSSSWDVQRAPWEVERRRVIVNQENEGVFDCTNEWRGCEQGNTWGVCTKKCF